MPTPKELRELSQLGREAEKNESVTEAKRKALGQALALAQLAEKIERDDASKTKRPKSTK